MTMLSIAPLSLLALVSGDVASGWNPGPSWAGTDPSYMEQSYNIHCKGDELLLVFAFEKPDGTKLIKVERNPQPLLPIMERDLADTISEFSRIEKVEIFCGTSSDDMPAASSKEFDFTGTISIKFLGRHKSSIIEAKEQCDDLEGRYSFTTARHLMLETSSVRRMGNDTIGYCATDLITLKGETKPEHEGESK